MKALALTAPLALAACGGGGDAPTAASTNAADGVSATEQGEQIGTVSNLSAQTSALTGAVSDFAVERTDYGTRVLLAADTLFEFDKATLTPAAQANIARTAEQIRQGGAGTVTVTGYTDAKGEDAYNLALSRRRAEAVVAALKTQPGLGDRRFDAVGKGEADPVAPNATANGGDDPEGRARNRRVVVDIPGKQTAVASPDTPLTARGWGPLKVGMTRGAVTQALGASGRPDLVEGPEPEKCAEFQPKRAPDGMIVMLEDQRLTRVSVGKGRLASDRGIRVGDPVAKVRAAYKGAMLEDKPHTYQDAPARYLTWWAPGQAGKRGIRYEINSDGKVGSIHAGGPSIRYVEGCL